MRNQLIIFGLLISIICFSCSDIFEKELDTKKVRLLSPSDGTVLEVNTVNFWWEYLDDVDFYNVRVVQPSFDSIHTLILDVDVEDDFQYELTDLPIGSYEWTVIAHNSNSNSLTNINHFTIADSSSTTESFDLSDITPQLIYPTPSALINKDSIAVLWQFVDYATSYEVQVASPDYTNSTYFIIDEETQNDYVSVNLMEGTYQWRVRAKNAFSVSNYTSQYFTVDLTAPSAPNLIHPVHLDTISTDTIALSWSVDSDVLEYQLEIYSDSLLTNLVFNDFTNSTLYEWTDVTEGTYFWRVKGRDEAMNWSAFSTVNSFIKD